MPLGPSLTTPRPGVRRAMVNRSLWLGTTRLCSGMPWILKTCSRRCDVRSADRGTSGVPPAKLGQANGLNALLRCGADDGNRTRVFSLGSYFQRRTAIRTCPVGAPSANSNTNCTCVFGSLSTRPRFGAAAAAVRLCSGYARGTARGDVRHPNPYPCNATGAPRGQFLQVASHTSP